MVCLVLGTALLLIAAAEDCQLEPRGSAGWVAHCSTLDLEEASIQNLSRQLEDVTDATSLELDVTHNHIGNSGLAFIAAGLKKLERLSSLTLLANGNGIGDDGVRELAAALARQSSLTSLTLSMQYNDIGRAGAGDLGAALRKIESLESLIILAKFNHIGNQGAGDLGAGLAGLSRITFMKLDLYSNGIEAAGAADLAMALGTLKTLQSLTLDLHYNAIVDQGIRDIWTGLNTLPQATSVHVIGVSSLDELPPPAAGEPALVLRGAKEIPTVNATWDAARSTQKVSSPNVSASATVQPSTADDDAGENKEEIELAPVADIQSMDSSDQGSSVIQSVDSVSPRESISLVRSTSPDKFKHATADSNADASFLNPSVKASEAEDVSGITGIRIMIGLVFVIIIGAFITWVKRARGGLTYSTNFSNSNPSRHDNVSSKAAAQKSSSPSTQPPHAKSKAPSTVNESAGFNPNAATPRKGGDDDFDPNKGTASCNVPAPKVSQHRQTPAAPTLPPPPRNHMSFPKRPIASVRPNSFENLYQKSVRDLHPSGKGVE